MKSTEKVTWKKFNWFFWPLVVASAFSLYFLILTEITLPYLFYVVLIAPSLVLGFLLAFFSYKINGNWSLWWIFFTAFPILFFSFLGWIILYMTYQEKTTNNSELDRVNKKWVMFKLFFWFDIISFLMIIFFVPGVVSFFPALQGFDMIISSSDENSYFFFLLSVKLFQLSSLFVYGHFGYFFGKNKFIGLWKLIPFFGYIPLYLSMSDHKNSLKIEFHER